VLSDFIHLKDEGHHLRGSGQEACELLLEVLLVDASGQKLAEKLDDMVGISDRKALRDLGSHAGPIRPEEAQPKLG
jgi:hypothetical protein